MPLSGSPLRGPVDRRAFLRWSALTAGAIGGAGLLAACGGSQSGAEPAAPGSGAYGTEALQLSWIKNTQFIGEYMADDRGYYTEAGFEGIELLSGGSAATGVEANLVSGNCWAGLSSPVLTAPAILQGAPLKIVGATYQLNPFCIVSGADDPIPEPAAMVGRRIGVQDSNDQVWGALLRANNIDPNSITRVPVQFDAAPLTTGEVDGYLAYITNEPNVLEFNGFPVATFLFAEYGLPFTAETVTVLQETSDTEREKLKAFLRAEVRGWNDAVRELETAVRLTVDVYGSDLGLDYEGQIVEARDQNQLVITPDTRANGLFTMTDQLVEENLASMALAGSPITREQLFDLTLLDEVYAEDPSLRVALP